MLKRNHNYTVMSMGYYPTLLLKIGRYNIFIFGITIVFDPEKNHVIKKNILLFQKYIFKMTNTSKHANNTKAQKMIIEWEKYFFSVI